MGDDLGAAARDWVSERTDYPRHVAQLAAHKSGHSLATAYRLNYDCAPRFPIIHENADGLSPGGPYRHSQHVRDLVAIGGLANIDRLALGYSFVSIIASSL